MFLSKRIKSLLDSVLHGGLYKEVKNMIRIRHNRKVNWELDMIRNKFENNERKIDSENGRFDLIKIQDTVIPNIQDDIAKLENMLSSIKGLKDKQFTSSVDRIDMDLYKISSCLSSILREIDSILY